MRYETIKHLKDTDFKRLSGVKRATYESMLKVIEKGIRDFGRPPKLSRADQLLMTLMYWREYRTEFHIAQSYGISEATVCRTVQKVEIALARSGKFRLPGKKALQPSDTVFEVVLVDASEQPIERPKKPKSALQCKKKRHTQKAQLIAVQKTAEIVASPLALGASTTSSFSRMMRAKLWSTFEFWQMLAIKDWQNSMKIARRLSRNPNIIL